MKLLPLKKPLFDVSFIIVNWNGKKNLETCLREVFKIKTKYTYEIVIVDNGSIDDSVSYLKNLVKSRNNIQLVLNKKNLGYAGGNNTGIIVTRGKILLLLNNDTYVEKNFLDPLVDFLLKNKKVAGVQPKIMNYPNKDIVDSVGSYFINTGFLYHIGHNKKSSNKKFNNSSEVFTMKGACMAFKREVLCEVGIFDDSYFAYFEETDLCQRMLMAGYKISYVPNSTIYHMGGETSKHLASSFVQYHSYKNRIRTYLKNFELKTLVWILPVHIIMCEIVSVMYLITFKFSLFLSIQRAFWWNFVGLRSLIKERKKIKRMKKVTDKEYLPGITKQVRWSYYYHLFATALSGYDE